MIENIKRFFKGSGTEPEDLDKRNHQRNNCYISSEYRTGDIAKVAVLKNLNSDGAFLETSDEFKVGEEIDLTFSIHYLEPPLEIKAIVAWSGLDGVGLKFVNNFYFEKRAAG